MEFEKFVGNKELLERYLDNIDKVSSDDLRNAVHEIENELLIRKAKDQALFRLESLNSDIEYFFEHGGSLEELEDKIKNTAKPSVYITDQVKDVYNKYLDNLYRFVMFECFVGRDTLLKEEDIKDFINNKVVEKVEKLKEGTNAIPFNIAMRLNEVEKINDKYRYLDVQLLGLLYYHDSELLCMTKDLRNNIINNEYDKVSNDTVECSKRIDSNKGLMKKLKKYGRLWIVLTILSISTYIFKVSPYVDTLTHIEENKDENEKKGTHLLLLSLCVIFILSHNLKLNDKKQEDCLKELGVDEELLPRLQKHLDDIGSMLSVIDEEKDVDNELRLTKEKILRKTN